MVDNKYNLLLKIFFIKKMISQKSVYNGLGKDMKEECRKKRDEGRNE